MSAIIVHKGDFCEAAPMLKLGDEEEIELDVVKKTKPQTWI